jgi:protein-tyrosine phosphatase
VNLDPTFVDLDSDPSEYDPLQRRMAGVTRHGYIRFDAPFISHIEGNLWMGGCEAGLLLPENIEHVVSLYPWEQYELIRDLQSELTVRLFDDTRGVNTQKINTIADWAMMCLSEGPTLIHCQAGLNRSGLVAALTLVRGGMAPVDAIQLLREKRSPAVLCNPTFERWLLNQGTPS